MRGGPERPAGLARLDDDHGLGHAADEAVSIREVVWPRRCSWRVFREPCAPRTKNPPGKTDVPSGPGPIETTRQDRHGSPAGVQRALVGRGVDSVREAAHDPNARPGEGACESGCGLASTLRRPSGAHDRDHGIGGQTSGDVQEEWRIGDLEQARRKPGVGLRDQTQTQGSSALQLGPGSPQGRVDSQTGEDRGRIAELLDQPPQLGPRGGQHVPKGDPEGFVQSSSPRDGRARSDTLSTP